MGIAFGIGCIVGTLVVGLFKLDKLVDLNKERNEILRKLLEVKK